MTKERNYSIELLRLLSMFFIVVLHFLGHGGVLEATIENSIQYKCAWFLEIICYCAVDIFALISGYVSYKNEEKEIKINNYLKLWFEVCFYTLLITIIIRYINPSIVQTKDFVHAIMPVTFNYYWYFTAYTGLFIFMPLINKAVRNLSERTAKKIFLILIIVFSVYGTIFPIFVLNNGYSFIWLTILYTLGAIMKKCQIGKNLKKYQAVLLITSLSIITFITFIYGKELNLFDITITKKLFVNYTSPTVLISAVLYLILFNKIKLPKILSKIIKFLSTSSFAIYLINENYLIRNNYIKGKLRYLATTSPTDLLFKVLAYSIIFIICAMLIDKVRFYIFKLIKVDKLCSKLNSFIKSTFNYAIK